MIVNANGSIDGTQVLKFGKEYTSSPTMNVLYRSSNISQEGSVSIIKVVSPGVNFLADGVLRVTGGSTIRELYVQDDIPKAMVRRTIKINCACPHQSGFIRALHSLMPT